MHVPVLQFDRNRAVTTSQAPIALCDALDRRNRGQEKQGSEYSFSGPQGLSAGQSQEQVRRNRTLTLVSEAATNPQGRARPAVGNQREMATDSEAARPRDAEIPLTNVRSARRIQLVDATDWLNRSAGVS